MSISSKSKIFEVLDDPRAVAIMEEYSPGFADNPMMKMVKNMVVADLIKFPQVGFTAEQQADIIARFDALAD